MVKGQKLVFMSSNFHFILEKFQTFRTEKILLIFSFQQKSWELFYFCAI